MRRFFCLLVLSALLLLAILLLRKEEPVSLTEQSNAASMGILLLEENDGLYVLAVIEQSVAAKANIEPGDLLYRANDIPLTSVSEFDTLLNTSNKENRLRLTLTRDGAQLIRYLP